VSPLLLIINPVAGKIQDAREAQFNVTASRQSLWVLLGLGLIVVGFFGYLYLREWWLERGFRRYRMGMAQEQSGHEPVSLAAPRKPLVAGPIRVRKEDGNGAGGNGNRRVTVGAIVGPTRAAHNSTSSATRVTAARGLVVVQADDPFHEIYVDNSFVGNAPARLNLVEGAHWIEIRKAGRRTYRRELNVLAGAEVNLHAVLEESAREAPLRAVPQDPMERS